VASLNRMVGGRKDNLREMLLAAGIGEYNAILSLPYMYFMPRTCDPYMQGVMQLVEGLQNLLRGRGARITMNGTLGADTAAAVARFSGPGWRDKTWMQIYGDVLRGRVLDPPAMPEPEPVEATSGILDAVATNPLAWLAGGAAAYFFLGRRKARS